MKRLLVLLLLVSLPLVAQQPEKQQDANANAAALTINLEPLGDSDAGVVNRVTFRYTLPQDVPPEAIALQGSILQGGTVVKNFRFMLNPRQVDSARTIITVPAGETEIEARLVVAYDNLVVPIIVGKESKKFTVAKTNRTYVATAEDGAEAILAEGIVPESVGAVKIRPPRRDVAPNLFIVDVETAPQVKKVEFWVENKKIMTRNAPPYHAELDLGKLPKRVEVRAIGYDAQGRYVDADAFIVNERETPLEVKITRTVTPDQVSHFKLSVQNPKNTEIKSVVFFAGKQKIYEWSRPPYAVDIPNARLAGVDFVRAAVTDETSYEAGDLLFLNGDRYTEEIEVNLVELPVTVTDPAGLPVPGLTEKNFQILENGKPQKITSFNYASNLPISAGVLIDHSGSMEKRMEATKQAAVEFFKDIMKGKDRAFIGGFAFDASKLAPFVSDVSVLEQQVAAIPAASGGTALYDAIVTGLYRFRNVQGRKALIVLTDGEDTTSRLPYDEMLTYVRASRVPIYFIGIGLGFADMGGTSKMKALAAETGGVAYFIRDVKQLKETYAALEKDLRSQYLVAYYTESTKKDTAYRAVEVKVDRPDAKVRTIRGFIP
ncbi:MAG TPA: VWA domain-containing protein [Thermoanaerobaculia bacterium]|nr:VWA domain-containing protein [Thermoanaerobaculia bacterium]